MSIPAGRAHDVTDEHLSVVGSGSNRGTDDIPGSLHTPFHFA